MIKVGELKQTIQKSKRCIVYAAVFSFFVNLLMLTPPLYMLQLYDRVVTSRSESTLFFLTLIVLILFAVMGIFEVLRSRILIIFANQLDMHLTERIYDAIFKLASRFPGRVSSQAMSDLNSIKQYMSRTIHVIKHECSIVTINVIVTGRICFFLILYFIFFS